MSQQRNKRNIDVSEDDLKAILHELEEYENKFMTESFEFLKIGKEKDDLHTMDLYISAITNRAISLNSAFRILCSNNNYIVAASLIRIQVDNLLRLYAATIVSDRDQFFIRYLEGEHIRNLIDVKGKKMTDTYLVNRFDSELYPGIKNLYVNTSGYVHLSNEHSFLQTETKSQQLITKIGLFDFFKIDQKVDFAYNMLVASEFLFKIVHSWTLYKKGYYQE